MSSRFHNKYHRHNHHSYPSLSANYPDSSHDPIASKDNPFFGDFVLNGGLSASVPSVSAYVAALFGKVGINTITPNQDFTVMGNISASAATTTTQLSVNNNAYVANQLGVGFLGNNPPTADAFYVGGNSYVTNNSTTTELSVIDVQYIGNKLGIGTNNPQYQLDIVGSANVSNNVTTTELSVSDTQYIGNRLGIGTNNPQTPLHVIGNVTIMGNLSTYGNLTYLDTLVTLTSALSVHNNGTGPAVSIVQTGNNPVMAVYDGNNLAFFVDGSNTAPGNVGIGLSGGGAKLTIAGTVSCSNALTANNGFFVVNAVSPFLSAQSIITSSLSTVLLTATSISAINITSTALTATSISAVSISATSMITTSGLSANNYLGGNTTNWNNAYTTVSSNSANWANTVTTNSVIFSSLSVSAPNQTLSPNNFLTEQLLKQDFLKFVYAEAQPSILEFTSQGGGSGSVINFYVGQVYSGTSLSGACIGVTQIQRLVSYNTLGIDGAFDRFLWNQPFAFSFILTTTQPLFTSHQTFGVILANPSNNILPLSSFNGACIGALMSYNNGTSLMNVNIVRNNGTVTVSSSNVALLSSSAFTNGSNNLFTFVCDGNGNASFYLNGNFIGTYGGVYNAGGIYQTSILVYTANNGDAGNSFGGAIGTVRLTTTRTGQY